MATSLQPADGAIDSEVALAAESNVRRPAEGGEAKTNPAHGEPG